MEASSVAATWLSFIATTVGLGGLIAQANLISERLDPFYPYRNNGHLGIWLSRQEESPWYALAKHPPTGPSIRASLKDQFCDKSLLYVTRKPVTSLGDSGTASWAALLATFHAEKPSLAYRSDYSQTFDPEKALLRCGKPKLFINNGQKEWSDLAPPRPKMKPLKQYQHSVCVTISRITFITFLCLTNARPAFQHSDASGLRAAYPSYGGQWHINWPIGQEAMVKLMPMDSHEILTDLYPLHFVQRVQGCILMLCGIVWANKGEVKIAFCGRKYPGDYVLRFIPKGFPGAHGSRHLYNMMGGNVPEVDFMSAVKETRRVDWSNEQVLDLPSREDKDEYRVRMMVPAESQEKIKIALDCLPWNSLSFSVHRGMQDILLAYGKPVMDTYRKEFAALVKDSIERNAQKLGRKKDGVGYNDELAEGSLGAMAEAAILEGKGDSGDLVRIVTDAVRVMLGHEDLASKEHFKTLDEVKFWRMANTERRLNDAGIIALTKFFVLEWSIPLNYQLYHQLPVTMNFG
jgi:hypothetical protein